MPQFQQLYKFVAVLPDEKYDMQLFQKISCNVQYFSYQYNTTPRTYWSTAEWGFETIMYWTCNIRW